jgi:hypothetical protein
MPFEKVAAPPSLVVEYGAQSHPPVQLIHRPPQSTCLSKITLRVFAPSPARRRDGDRGNVYRRNWSAAVPISSPLIKMRAPIFTPSNKRTDDEPLLGVSVADDTLKVVEYLC